MIGDAGNEEIRDWILWGIGIMILRMQNGILSNKSKRKTLNETHI